MRKPHILDRLAVLAGRISPRAALAATGVTALLTASALVWLHNSGAATATCSLPQVTIRATDAADARVACVGAGRAIAYLANFDLHPRAPIVIAVEPELKTNFDAKLLGFYDPAQKIVKVLAGSAFSRGTADKTVFGVEIDADVHASIFAHEVTHAVIDQNTDILPLAAAGHEYLAYSVQIATLPVAHRHAVIDHFDGNAFSDPTQVSDLILAFDPNGFAVRAYLHFRNAEDRGAVLEALAAAPRLSDYELY